jgi:hypothetical protein
MIGQKCESCGMPMMSINDHAAKNTRSRYCKYCTNAEGMLQSPQERLEKLTAFLMEDGLSREAANKKALEQMRKMPAWKGKI